MLTFLAILKWISLVVAIILFILSIVEFLTDEEDIAPWFFLFAIIFGIGFFVFGAFIKNMNEYETVNKMSKKEVKSIISEKVSPENFLCEIDEPKYFIVAPMSYDISEFEKKSAQIQNLKMKY